MAQHQMENDRTLGAVARPARKRRGMQPGDVIAAVLSGLWLAACVTFFLVLDPDAMPAGPAGFIMTILAIFLPVAIIWLAASAARSAQVMREETERLQSTIDAMRQSYLTQSHTPPAEPVLEVEAKLAKLEEAQKHTEQAMATFSSTRRGIRPEPAAAPQAHGEVDAQPTLALDPQPSDTADPLETDEFIRALHFPETAEDQDGFRALRRALQDRKVAKLIQAAQDVLTLLSQDGIYMDDLRPDRARPEIWRQFAAGHRGREVAALGGIRDRSSLALTAGRMRNDPIFRDAAHHFLRRFDEIFLDFEKTASDEDIARLSNTRTARAFMLLGRVTGTFS